MAGLNRVVLMGNLTREPQIRQIQSGTSVADLALATSDVSRDKNGQPVERTCYVDIVTWGKQAEACAKHLSKGSSVVVEGRLQFDQWETDNGQRRSKLLVRADRVQFLGRPRSAGDQTQPQPEEAMAF